MNDNVGAHSNELLSIQIWNLLPSFCNNVPDIKNNFKVMKQIFSDDS